MDDSMARGLVSRYQRESTAAHKRHQLFWLKHANRNRPLQPRQQRKIFETSIKNMRPFLSGTAHGENNFQAYGYWMYIEQCAGFYPINWIWDRLESFRPTLLDSYQHDFIVSNHAAQRILQAHSPRWDHIGMHITKATESYQRILIENETDKSTVFMSNEDESWWVFDKHGAVLVSKAYNDPSNIDSATDDKNNRVDVLNRSWFHVIKTYIPFDKWDEWRHRTWDKWLLDDTSVGIALQKGDVVNLCSAEISEEDRRNAKSVFRYNGNKRNKA